MFLHGLLDVELSSRTVLVKFVSFLSASVKDEQKLFIKWATGAYVVCEKQRKSRIKIVVEGEKKRSGHHFVHDSLSSDKLMFFYVRNWRRFGIIKSKKSIKRHEKYKCRKGINSKVSLNLISNHMHYTYNTLARMVEHTIRAPSLRNWKAWLLWEWKIENDPVRFWDNKDGVENCVLHSGERTGTSFLIFHSTSL